MNNAFKKFDLTGKTAVVTGGATGLGYYMTRGLMRSGATVMMAARRENVLQESAERLRQESDTGEVLYHKLDLADRESIEVLCNHAIETMGGVDIFIGNAAVELRSVVDSVTYENIDQTMQINLISNMIMTSRFLPHMRKNKWGRLIYSSSTGGERGTANGEIVSYAASKGGLNAYTRAVAAETGHDGITANCLGIGVYLTELAQEVVDNLEKESGPGAGKAFINGVASSTALGRMGRPDEVEGLIQFMASDAGSYYTGTTTAVDGGLAIMLNSSPVPENPVYPPEA